MRRVAVIADSHFDSSPGGRWEECIEVHRFIAQDIEEQGVDLVLHAGDVYERRSTPEERREVADWVQRVAAVAPMVIVRGNHDAARDLVLLELLKTQNPVIVEEACGVFCVGGCVVGAMAWPNKASVLSMAERAMGHQEGELVAGEALRNVLRGLGDGMKDAADFEGMDDAPRILLAHAMVRGSKVSTGQPLVGCDLELGVDDLALTRADFVALGHIHMPQEWHETQDQHAVYYPGSPRRTAFGEVEQKGYLIVEFNDAGELDMVQRVPTPCAPMLLLEAEWTGGRFVGDTDRDHEADGAEVRFRYEVAPDQREAAKASALEYRDALLGDGAVLVKVEERVVSSTRARAPEVARAKTLKEKLRAYWEARGQVPESERGERLLSMSDELEVSR